jgi:polar amino acid transport system substrate-binding protein
MFKWVGPLAIKRDILIARKDAPFTIAALEDAKQVGSIGTLRDDTRQEFLLEMGFTNLHPVSDDKQNARKLALGRIDLWAYKIPGMNTVCRLAGVDPGLFSEVLNLRQVEVSIAFSRKTSDTIVDGWRQAFKSMQEDGTIEEIHNKWHLEE